MKIKRRKTSQTVVNWFTVASATQSELTKRVIEAAFADYQVKKGAELLRFSPVGPVDLVDDKYSGQVLSVSAGEGEIGVLLPEYTAPLTSAAMDLANGRNEVRFAYSPASCARVEKEGVQFFGQLGLEWVRFLPEADSLAKDACMIQDAQGFLELIGLGGRTTTRVNDTKPIVSYLENEGVTGARRDAVLKAVDRGDEIPWKELFTRTPRELRSLVEELKEADTLDSAGPRVRALYDERTVDRLQEMLPGAVFSPKLVRGLSFYNSYGNSPTVVFEIFPKGGSGGAICGGGRYDGLYNKLAERLGRSNRSYYCATGYAFGRERLADLAISARKDAEER